MPKVLAIGDMHFPFEDKSYLKKLMKRVKEEKPDIIIQLGDLYDQYMFSRYDQNLDRMSPKKELELARSKACAFWKNISKASPKSKKIQLLGNHDNRILKQILRRFPSAFSILKEAHTKLYTFEGVETHLSDRDYIEIDNIIYTHGWQAKHIRHFGKSVVRAHDHQAWMYEIGDQKEAFGGIVIHASHVIARNPHTLFEVSSGMYGDEKATPFEYTTSKFTNWKPAIVIVTKDLVRLEIL